MTSELTTYLDAVDPSTPVTELIPSTMAPDRVVELTRYLNQEYEKNSKRSSILLALLGRLYYMASTDRRILDAAGVSTLKEYETEVLGAAHATMGLISGSYKAFPWMTPSDYVDIGPSKLREACRAVRGKDLSESQRREVLDMVREADNSFHARHKIDNGTGEFIEAELLLKSKKIDMDELEGWLADEPMQKFLESTDPVVMMNRAFQEVSSGMRGK